MTTIHYTEEDTSEEKVKEFLEEIGDYNPIHWNDHIFPGMFALHLLERTINRPLSRINLVFNKMAKFPTSLELELEDSEINPHLVFHKNDETLYEGDLHYNKGNVPNTQLLQQVYRIGGKLQEKFKEENLFPEETIGIYTYQAMDFKEGVHSLSDPYFPSKEKLDKRTYKVLTFCNNSDEEVGAEGHAAIMGISKRLFERMIQQAT